MPLSILLVRHAKSDWQDPALDDHERPLNKRGQRDAPRIGRFIADAGLLPDLVLASTALRARLTAEAAMQVWSEDDDSVPIDYLDALYPTDVDTSLALLRELPDSVERAMLVGHNPGMEELLDELTGVAEAMPTAAVAVVELAVDHWALLEPGATAPQGHLRRLWRPKDELAAHSETPAEADHG